jgi:hypothetical protein
MLLCHAERQSANCLSVEKHEPQQIVISKAMHVQDQILTLKTNLQHSEPTPPGVTMQSPSQGVLDVTLPGQEMLQA